MTRTVFLPGAGGSSTFWEPVQKLMARPDDLLFGWPGFGDEQPVPTVHSLSDLPAYVLEHVDGDFNLVAQSMGGVVALQIALKVPSRVRRLVLCGTSGGVDFGAIEREDWRPGYVREMPEQTPRWFVDDRTDLTSELWRLVVPVLLIWGCEDRIVPPSAGHRLESLLPNARLVVVPGAGHDVAQSHAAEVASHIGAFLGEATLYLEEERGHAGIERGGGHTDLGTGES